MNVNVEKFTDIYIPTSKDSNYAMNVNVEKVTDIYIPTSKDSNLADSFTKEEYALNLHSYK